MFLDWKSHHPDLHPSRLSLCRPRSRRPLHLSSNLPLVSLAQQPDLSVTLVVQSRLRLSEAHRQLRFRRQHPRHPRSLQPRPPRGEAHLVRHPSLLLLLLVRRLSDKQPNRSHRLVRPLASRQNRLASGSLPRPSLLSEIYPEVLVALLRKGQPLQMASQLRLAGSLASAQRRVARAALALWLVSLDLRSLGRKLPLPRLRRPRYSARKTSPQSALRRIRRR